MRPHRGSWPVLLALAAAFVGTFYWQRHRSTFLHIERQRDAAQMLASLHGVATADVMALRDLVGPDASDLAWQQVVLQFAQHVGQHRDAAGDPLPGAQETGAQKTGAPQTVVPQPVVPQTVVPRTGVSATGAESAELRAIRAVAPDALAARRFELLRARFAARR